MALGQQIAHALGLATTADIRNLEERMSTAETAAEDRLAAVIGTIKAEMTSLRDQVAAFPDALADAFARGDQAGAEKIAADALRDADRLNLYADQLAELVPATVPEVVVPDAGVPAEPPADSGVSVPEVPEPEVSVTVPEASTGENPAAGDDNTV